jgi:DNA-3-methyladenine glycosylase II
VMYFPYGDTEINYLKRRDRRLGQAIDDIGPIKRKMILDPFTALIRTIIGQQISTKAAQTVCSRMYELVGDPIDPGILANVGLTAIQGCGMSERKAGYILGAANAVLSGEVNFDALHTLTDAEIVKKLTALRGVGVWTAEMILIFSLGRPDVVSYGDLGIRRGMAILYGLDEVSREQSAKYAKRYSPYGTVASLYLWHLAGQ